MITTVKLHNTLTKQVEPIQSQSGGSLRMFVCGPTVYDYSHLGHAKTYTQFDVLARVLRRSGYSLTYLQNITDIDDKIIIRANEQHTSWRELTKEFTEAYLDDMTWLGNTSVDTYAAATDFIEDIIRQVQTLLDNNYAYKIDSDGIYFEIEKFKNYGKLSGRTKVEKDDAESRIDQSEQKRGWNDFCLWKFQKEDEPSWAAPFGDGRPGWHIEDTAITEHFYGPQYDLHGGAVDLIFPHHEAEVTQMEAASGKSPFVKYWVHTGFLNIDNTKMSKSLGNFTTIKDLRGASYDPYALRLFFLQSHYRSTLNFTAVGLKEALQRLQRWKNMASLRWQAKEQGVDITGELASLQENILSALQDDLQTPRAISHIERLFDYAHEGMSLASAAIFTDSLQLIDEVFNLHLLQSTPDTSNEIKELISEREMARDEKDFARADELRARLLNDHKIELKDTDQGSLWFRVY